MTESPETTAPEEAPPVVPFWAHVRLWARPEFRALERVAVMLIIAGWRTIPKERAVDLLVNRPKKEDESKVRSAIDALIRAGHLALTDDGVLTVISDGIRYEEPEA